MKTKIVFVLFVLALAIALLPTAALATSSNVPEWFDTSGVTITLPDGDHYDVKVKIKFTVTGIKQEHLTGLSEHQKVIVSFVKTGQPGYVEYNNTQYCKNTGETTGEISGPSEDGVYDMKVFIRKAIGMDYAILAQTTFAVGSASVSAQQPTTPTQPTTPAQPAANTVTAVPAASKVLVGGQNVAFDAYNIGGNNYFKLRDLAYTMNGSEKQFNVSWDGTQNAINIITKTAYSTTGGEMTGKGFGNTQAVLSTSKVLVDGKAVSLTAYNIGGNNYFKLRDVAAAIDFGVEWDGAAQTIKVDMAKGYTAETPAQPSQPTEPVQPTDKNLVGKWSSDPNTPYGTSNLWAEFRSDGTFIYYRANLGTFDVLDKGKTTIRGSYSTSNGKLYVSNLLTTYEPITGDPDKGFKDRSSADEVWEYRFKVDDWTGINYLQISFEADGRWEGYSSFAKPIEPTEPVKPAETTTTGNIDSGVVGTWSLTSGGSGFGISNEWIFKKDGTFEFSAVSISGATRHSEFMKGSFSTASGAITCSNITYTQMKERKTGEIWTVESKVSGPIDNIAFSYKAGTDSEGPFLQENYNTDGTRNPITADSYKWRGSN